MSKVQVNKHIARLIVGAMSIDGELSKADQIKVISALEALNMSELTAYFGEAIESDFGDFDLFEECRGLLLTLGTNAEQSSQNIFRLIGRVVVSDRFVSVQEASYLSALAKRLKIPIEISREIFKAVMIEKRGRLEVAPREVDALLHPHLKELLSFEGADEIVGPHSEDSLEELLETAKEYSEKPTEYSTEDIHKALSTLGLSKTASLEEAKQSWLKLIEQVDLLAMARLGETFVAASLSRLSEVTAAYKLLAEVRSYLETKHQSKVEVERLEKKIDREKAPTTRDKLSSRLEGELTGVGVKQS